MKKYCGDFGGLNQAGGPCKRPAGSGRGEEHAGKGLCVDHYKHDMSGRPAMQRGFLAALIECGTISGAARASDIHRDTHYGWLDTDPSYRDRFTAAQKQHSELLESEASRRGKDGVRRYLYTRNGQPITDPRTGEQAYELKFSDTLLMFRLNALEPEKYRSRHEVSGPGGGPIPMKHDYSGMSLAELAERRQAALGSTAGAE